MPIQLKDLMEAATNNELFEIETSDTNSVATVVPSVAEDASDVSTEDCASCQAAAQTGKPSNMVTNAASIQTNQAEDKKNSFTYDEGKGQGKKDIIQLTGPLSEVYTRALNIYFAKKPAFDAESVPEGMTQSETEELLNSSMIPKPELSSESVQLDDVKMGVLLNEIKKEMDENQIEEEAKDKFEFVNDTILSDIKHSEPRVLAYFMTLKRSLQPQVIDVVQTKAEDKNKNVIMVITDETKYFARGTGIQRKWIDLAENAEYNPTYVSIENHQELKAVYSERGVTVVSGLSGLVKHLNALAKQ